MAGKLIGVPIPIIDWNEDYHKFKRQCQCIFDVPLKDEAEDMKVQYLVLWVGLGLVI